MDRYQKVEKPKLELPLNENEMRITSSGLFRNYISYATSLLQDKQAKEIVLKAMGQAISKTVAIAEILKRRIPGLHQDTAISSVSITDVWEPIEEGLVPVEMTRQVSIISITLSTRDLNKKSPGYQAPQHAEQQKAQYRYQPLEHQVRRPQNFYNGPNEDSYGQDSYASGSYGRGRGRGGGRGRGWSRGGYNNYEDDGGYSSWGRGGSRGRDRDYQGGKYGNYQDGGYERGGYERGGDGGYERGSRGGGYERGRSDGGRGYGGGRKRMGGRGR